MFVIVSPLFNFNVSSILPSENHTYKSFYTWRGTIKRVRQGRSTKTVYIEKPALITRLYKTKFYFSNINKTYFDYVVDSVKNNERCKKIIKSVEF